MIRKNEFSTATAYFFNKGWKVYPFQKECWEHIASQRSGLLNAPTGSGKTLAIWMGLVDKLQAENKFDKKGKLKCIWITPLRALSKEIYRATQAVQDELELPYTVALRTGDTSTAERKKQKEKAPDLLITTPESLHVLFTQKSYSKYFENLEMIVIDEWHELVGNKRGVLVELALSRLKAICPKLMIWGVSATIGNLLESKKILLGDKDKSAVMVSSDQEKSLDIQTVFPDDIETLPWAGHLGLKMVAKVIEIIEANNSTLIFTNTRGQAEVWYKKIIQEAPQLAGLLALHHGSLGMDTRLWVEENLHLNKLKAVVCTSSLDLGVDFRPVDTVIQIGSAKGIARFMQRAGRSGHHPEATSRIFFVPTNSLEIVEGAAIRQAIKDKVLEDRIPYVRSFDVLVQYLVSLSISEGFGLEIFHEIKGTHCFASMTEEEWFKVLQFITEGGSSLGAYTEFRKVYKDPKGVYRISDQRIARRHRMNIGAIVSEALLNVKYKNGKKLGVIEEYFISRLNNGDSFWYTGRNLVLMHIKDMDVIVRPGTGKGGAIPSFMGGRMPLSTTLAKNIQDKIHKFSMGDIKDDAELKFLAPLFELQAERSIVPKQNQLLIEKYFLKDGCHLCIFPFEGRFVHEGMSTILAARIARIKPITFSIAMNDYGFELLSDQDIPIEEALQQDLFSSKGLYEDIQKTVNTIELARRKFRNISVISGLVFNGFPGKQAKSKHLQASSRMFFQVFEEFEKDNLLFKQAFDEALIFQLEYARLLKTFERIEKQKIVLTYPAKPTPFSFPILVDGFNRERLSTEDLAARIEKMM